VATQAFTSCVQLKTVERRHAPARRLKQLGLRRRFQFIECKVGAMPQSLQLRHANRWLTDELG